ncbi:hypothetical protein EZJ49_02600 [Bdellovibrio bacteriovorus]|uniref:hypothetical protein n=1 Tax=Bdellovibrio bacteriovorus TaxID=959 RepID=UPI0021CE7D9A|nr:hypothetical protein [Bdellovibrio bacteriovorus]UXR65137.1 hypothetical protein EZJ49_02600 [Bdellovibrio bacteriovorus]
MKLKVLLLCFLLLNVVSCASAPSILSSKKDPTRSVYITEAFIYPEFRQVATAQPVAEKETAAVVAAVSSGSRAPASER